MLTARYVFSSILHASATSSDETRTTFATTAPYRAVANPTLASSSPPTTFGIETSECDGLPGSSRSGLNARKKSPPAFKPDCDKRGKTTVRVVVGYVVLSRAI